jgi:hypothetical protein
MRTFEFVIWALAAVVVFAGKEKNLRHSLGSEDFPEPGYPAPSYAPIVFKMPLKIIPLFPTGQPTASSYYAP